MKVRIQNLNRPGVEIQAGVLQTPWARARGYILRRAPEPDAGLLFLYRRPRKVSVHMFGVPFPLMAVWINADKRVVGTVTLSPWVGVAASPVPVTAFLECAPGSAFHPGDQLEWASS